MICFINNLTNLNCLFFGKKSKNGSSWSKIVVDENDDNSSKFSINFWLISFSFTANERYKRWQARENYSIKEINKILMKNSTHTNIDWTSESDWREDHWVSVRNGPLWLNPSSTGGMDDENDKRHSENHPNER